jgi:hypothetical protein
MRSSIAAITALLTLWISPLFASPPESTLKVGQPFSVSGKIYKVAEADVLPLVENQYTARFRFDSFDNPKLKDLRGKCHFRRSVLEAFRRRRESI